MNEAIQQYLERKVRRVKGKKHARINEKLDELMRAFDQSPIEQEEVRRVYQEIKRLVDSKGYASESKMSRKLIAGDYQNRKLLSKISRLYREQNSTQDE